MGWYEAAAARLQAHRLSPRMCRGSLPADFGLMSVAAYRFVCRAGDVSQPRKLQGRVAYGLFINCWC